MSFVLYANRIIKSNRNLQKSRPNAFDAGFKLPLPRQSLAILEPVSPLVAEQFRQETARLQRRNNWLTWSILLLTITTSWGTVWWLTH